MNREEYMNTLKEVLLGYNQEFASDVIKDYEDHFEISLKDGRSEEDICRELGDVNEAIEQLKQDFIDYKKQELIHLSKGKEWKQDESEEKGNKKETRNETGKESTEQENGFDKNNSEAKNEEIVNDKVCFGSDTVRKLVLQLSFEDLFLEGTKGDEITIEYEGKKAEKSFHCEQRGDTIYAESIRSISQFKVNFFRFGILFDKTAEVRVSVPAYLEEVEIRTASGETYIKYVDCKKLNYSGASGDVDMKQCSIEKIEIRSASGEVRIEESKSDNLKAKSMSGDIEIIKSQTGRCLMESMSGDTTMKYSAFQTVYGSSKSGDIEIVLTEKTTGVTVETSTISGDTKAQYKGSITSSAHGTFRIIYGDGSCNVKASTISGDVRITD